MSVKGAGKRGPKSRKNITTGIPYGDYVHRDKKPPIPAVGDTVRTRRGSGEVVEVDKWAGPSKSPDGPLIAVRLSKSTVYVHAKELL